MPQSTQMCSSSATRPASKPVITTLQALLPVRSLAAYALAACCCVIADRGTIHSAHTTSTWAYRPPPYPCARRSWPAGLLLLLLLLLLFAEVLDKLRDERQHLGLGSLHDCLASVLRPICEQGAAWRTLTTQRVKSTLRLAVGHSQLSRRSICRARVSRRAWHPSDCAHMVSILRLWHVAVPAACARAMQSGTRRLAPIEPDLPPALISCSAACCLPVPRLSPPLWRCRRSRLRHLPSGSPRHALRP